MIIAGIFNASMDVLKVRYNTSIFSQWPNQNWVNPAFSWRNKWKSKNKIIRYLMSTVLVWTTDMWHFVKMLMLVSISLAIVTYQPIFTWYLDAIIMHSAFTVPFEIFFSKVFILPDKKS